MTATTEMTMVSEVINEIGGGGDRQNIITLRNGYTIWVAYGQVGVYRDADFPEGEAAVLWDYAGEVIPDGFYNVSDLYVLDTGGGVLVDVVMLRGMQEMAAPTSVCLTITDECIVYRAMNDLEADCPECGESVHSVGCPLAPFGSFDF